MNIKEKILKAREELAFVPEEEELVEPKSRAQLRKDAVTKRLLRKRQKGARK